MKQKSIYQQMIAKSLARRKKLPPWLEPRHIEASMRLQYGTLDHLSRATFSREIAVGVDVCRQLGQAEADEMADSFGL